MKLVSDWRNWWKWHSSHIFALMIAAPIAWAQAPQLQAVIPGKYAAWIAAALGALGLIGRLHDQALHS